LIKIFIRTKTLNLNFFIGIKNIFKPVLYKFLGTYDIIVFNSGQIYVKHI